MPAHVPLEPSLATAMASHISMPRYCVMPELSGPDMPPARRPAPHQPGQGQRHQAVGHPQGSIAHVTFFHQFKAMIADECAEHGSGNARAAGLSLAGTRHAPSATPAQPPRHLPADVHRLAHRGTHPHPRPILAPRIHGPALHCVWQCQWRRGDLQRAERAG